MEVLKAGGGTIDEIAMKVTKFFPEQKVATITGTTRVQVNRLSKSSEQGGRELKVKREETDKGFVYSI